MANGDIAYTNRESVGANKGFASGAFVGSGAAANIECGFQPSKIVLYNLTDASVFTWTKGMTAAHFIQQLTAGTTTVVTSGGPVVFAGDDDESMGFTIPATAVFNTAADSIVWEAWR